MVSQKRSRTPKKTLRLGHAQNGFRKTKVKKKVTWDKSIALRKEEFQELKNELELQGSKEALPVVTFVQELGPEEASCKTPKSRRFRIARFDLEDGRVDVLKVLENLGLPQIQIEQKPGDWCLLGNAKSGKSTARFKNGQVIRFRPIFDLEMPLCQHLTDRGNGKHPLKCRSYSGSSKPTVALTPKCSLRKRIKFSDGGMEMAHARPIFPPWKDKWIVAGDTLNNYYGRVSRLIEDCTEQGGGVCGIGVVLRLAFHEKHTRLLLTCGHIVGKDDKSNSPSIRGQLYAFGGPVKVLHVSKKYDIALLEGPPLLRPNGFNLAPEGEEQPGREVRLLTFPWYLDNVWGQLPLEEVQPSQMPGHVACMHMGGVKQNGTKDPLLVDAIATYMGGLPGCSGGAVTLNSKLLCGVHSGVYPFRVQNGVPQPVFLKENKPMVAFESNHQIDQPVRGERNNFPRLQRPSNIKQLPNLKLIGSPRFTRCKSTHGYFAVYVSSTHIRETCLEWYAKPKIKKILDSIVP